MTRCCPRCKEELSVAEFGKANYCKSCNYARVREWRQANPERARELVNDGKRRSYSNDPAAGREKVRKWRKENPDSVATWRSVYRARKKGAAVVEIINRTTVWDRDEGVCGICHELADPNNYHIDHIVPLSKGGDHSYSNVQVAHPACNFHKGARVQTNGRNT